MTIAERLQLSEDQRSALFYALLLKDAGCSSNAWKVTALFGADDFGVKKNLKTVNWSRLSQALRYVARTVSVAPFRSIAEVAASHHEKLDGSGYHRGVSAEDLNLPSRILAVADVFDALS
jgi:response regulator RpfG family c-di-GMP phosphodiesterase